MTTYSYNLDGSLRRITLPNGARSEYLSYDVMGRLTWYMQYDAAGQWIGDERYEYDPAGRVKHRNRGVVMPYAWADINNLGDNYGTDSEHAYFSYDALGRLTRSDVRGYGPQRTVEYGYDLANNRLWESVSREDPYDGTFHDFTQNTYNDCDQIVQTTTHKNVPVDPAAWTWEGVYYDPSYAGLTTHPASSPIASKMAGRRGTDDHGAP